MNVADIIIVVVVVVVVVIISVIKIPMATSLNQIPHFLVA